MVYIQLGINVDISPLQEICKISYKQLSSKFESNLTLISQYFAWDNILLNMYNT
jgi:hypothetical protein